MCYSVSRQRVPSPTVSSPPTAVLLSVNPSRSKVQIISPHVSYRLPVVMIAESTKQDKFLIKYVPIPPQTSQSSNFIDLVSTPLPPHGVLSKFGLV